MGDDERRAAAIREYQKTIVAHKEIETQSKKRACTDREWERERQGETERGRAIARVEALGGRPVICMDTSRHSALWHGPGQREKGGGGRDGGRERGR